MAMKEETKKRAKREIKEIQAMQYNKYALIRSKRWKADIINAFLEDDKFYTVEEAEQIINKKLKGEM